MEWRIRWIIAGTITLGFVSLPIARATSEEYPVSRFGQGPSKVITGMEADAVDDPSPVQISGGRAPAGLEVGPTKLKSGGPVPDSPKVAIVKEEKMNTPEAGAIRRNGVQEVALIAGDLGYFPKTIFVSRDVPVRMYVTGASKSTLCLMMDSFQVRKQLKSQKIEEISFTPNVPGRYRFYCPVNGMEGTLIVKEFSSTPTQQ